VLYAFVGTFAFGGFVYYATRPVYERSRRRIPPPSLAAAVSLFLLAYTLAVGLQEFQRLAESGAIDLGPFVPLIEPYLGVSKIVRDWATSSAPSPATGTPTSPGSSGAPRHCWTTPTSGRRSRSACGRGWPTSGSSATPSCTCS